MRSKRTRPVETRTKIHILTGGVKENVSQLELKGGELVAGENIQEIDGIYHGYSSLPGYEVCWGGTLPSEVPAPALSDTGSGNDVLLIISTLRGYIEDLSSHQRVINILGAEIDPYASRYGYGSIYVDTADPALTLPATSDFILGSSQWEIDFVGADMSDGVVCNMGQGVVIKNIAGVVTVEYGLNGAISTGVLTSGTQVPSPAHIAVSRSETKLRLAIEGRVVATADILATDAMTYLLTDWNDSDAWNDLEAWFDTPNFAFFDISGRFEEFRICKGTCKWVHDFTIPTHPYASDFFVPQLQFDDIAREEARALAPEVGGIDGTGPVRAVTLFEDEIFAVRDVLDAATLVYAKSIHPSFVENIGPSGLSSFPLGGVYQFTRGSFFSFGSALASHQEYIHKEVLFLVTGVTPPIWFDGLGYRHIDHANLPDNSVEDSPSYAVTARVFKDRLFLGYKTGQVWFSAVGDPLNFSTIDGAGTFYLGGGVTDLIDAPGDALIMFTRHTTNIAKTLADAGVQTSDATMAYKFFNESFSQNSGSINGTAQRVMGVITFADDRGVSSLEATNAYGDFNAGSLSKNVQRTFMSKKGLISCSTIIRENNQYRLFFTDKTGLIFTFDAEKKVKGVTTIRYNTPVMCIDTQKDLEGKEVTLFGSDDGFVYKMDSGTSFNGAPITTKFTTAFYNYSTPAYRKRFRKVTMESSAPRGMVFLGKMEFDYLSSFVPRGVTEELESVGSGGTYGLSKWGYFSYGSTAVETPTLYDDGYGENMSVTVMTSDKYRGVYTINSLIVEYVVVNRVHS